MSTATPSLGARDNADGDVQARKWWTLGAVCVGIFMLLLDITIVNVALPAIEHAFHAPLSDLQWVLDAYALTLAAFLLTSGSLADRLGRRSVFAAGIGIFTLGSLLCGVATNALFLILARGFQGLGGAVMFSTSLALLANAFHGRDRGTAFGVYGAVTGVAIAVGPVIGGVITSGISWRWIFFVNVPIGIVAFVVTMVKVEESRNPEGPRPDYLGFVTFSAGLAALVFAMIRSTADGWTSTFVDGSLIASAVLLACFVAVELRQATPMLDFSLLRLPTFSGGLVAAFGINASLFSLFTYVVLYLQNLLGLSAVGVGVRFLVLSGATFLTAGLAGRLTNHVPVKLLIVPGFVVTAVGILLMRGITLGDSWTHLIPGLILAGVGSGFINVPLASTAVGVVEPSRSGMASGINSTFRQVGTATGVAALGSIFASRIRDTITAQLAGTPLHAASGTIASAVLSGQTSAPSGSHTSPAVTELVRRAIGLGFIDGLNDILLIGGIVAIVAAALCAVLIRQKDFVSTAAPGSRAPERTGAELS
ncbi:MAG: MFS transporter [Acidimicrobiales bacterium]